MSHIIQVYPNLVLFIFLEMGQLSRMHILDGDLLKYGWTISTAMEMNLI